MESYKDLDKDIILNAPEGAMWWHTASKFYYRLSNDKVEYIDLGEEDGWLLSDNYSHVCSVQRETSYLIPLPNIEIPWEATEDSKCPVPDGIFTQMIWSNISFTSWHPNGSIGWKPSVYPIISYKIIDEDYLAEPIQDEPIEVEELEMHRAAYQAIKNAGFESPEELLAQHKCLLDRLVGDTSEDKLTRRLEFLQNLANKFPEIKAEAIKFMECELDGYMNTLWEKDNDNG